MVIQSNKTTPLPVLNIMGAGKKFSVEKREANIKKRANAIGGNHIQYYKWLQLLSKTNMLKNRIMEELTNSANIAGPVSFEY